VSRPFRSITASPTFDLGDFAQVIRHRHVDSGLKGCRVGG
jgi:hypothetical protein